LTEHIQKGIRLFESYYGRKFNKEFIVNTVTKYDGTPLKHSYVFFKSEQLANLFINKDLDGNDRIIEMPDPDHDTTQDIKNFQDFMMKPTPTPCDWVELVEEEEVLYRKTIQRNVRRPLVPVVNMGTVCPTPEQKDRHPDITEITVTFFPCKIPVKAGYSYSKLYAIHVSKDVSDSQIRKHFEPFSTSKKDKKYPIIYIDRKNNPTSVTVSFEPCSFDGIFALVMAKKLIVSEKCTLNFDLYREN
jgi:hypothetical protein